MRASEHLGAGQRVAMTLIEVIGVLAVIAILGSILLPALVRQIDKSVSDQEVGTLQSIGSAFFRTAMRNRYIPGPTNWTNVIAAELGMSVADVMANTRHQPRFLLVDPNFQVGSNSFGLPYGQTIFPFGSTVTNLIGQVIPPPSPRVMILSTLGRAFPPGVQNGVPPGSDFDIIWNWDDTSGTPPAATVLAGWGGKTDDLKVQRINLSSLFVHLLLSTYQFTNNGSYCVDLANTNAAPIYGIEGYFIQGSVLTLFKSVVGDFDSQQILTRDSSFVFDAGVWKGSIIGGRMPAGMDFSGAAAQFLSSPKNPNAGSYDQTQVANGVIEYMSNYLGWAADGFDKGKPSYTAATNSQQAMINSITNLLSNPPEVACPP